MMSHTEARVGGGDVKVDDVEGDNVKGADVGKGPATTTESGISHESSCSVVVLVLVLVIIIAIVLVVVIAIVLIVVIVCIVLPQGFGVGAREHGFSGGRFRWSILAIFQLRLAPKMA